MKKRRICIYPKDVAAITGRSESYGRRLVREIKDYLKKTRRQPITVKEFCDYMGFELEEVEESLL